MEREDLLEAGDFGGGQQAEAQWAFVVHGADDLYGGAAVLGGHDNIPEGGREGGGMSVLEMNKTATLETQPT
jgi:hypothetical protein